jgi:hypothetical protein
MSTKVIAKGLTVLTVLILVGCGGGGGTPDTNAPTVTSGLQVNAPRNEVTAVFSEAMNSATVNTSTFTLEDSGAPVAGKVSYSGVTATFTPSVQLGSNATYTATITTGAQDTSGNGVVDDVSWSLTTASGDIQISWNENPETAVNRSGGGYKVYYSPNSGFNPDDGSETVIDVPWTSTSVVISLDPGTYYIRIAAYSALNAPGTSGGSSSSASPQFTLNAP